MDAKKAAKFTALMEEGLEVLESIEADLAAKAKPKKAAGKPAKPG